MERPYHICTAALQIIKEHRQIDAELMQIMQMYYVWRKALDILEQLLCSVL